MWGCFLMSGVKILHFLKDWWKSIPIHQNYKYGFKKLDFKMTRNIEIGLILLKIYNHSKQIQDKM